MASWNHDSNWARGLVNLHQTPECRRTKYEVAQVLGASPALAQRMRDWRWAKIERWAHIDR